MAYQKLQVERAASVTPSDTVNISSPSEVDGGGNAVGINTGCVLYVGGAGDLKVKTASGDEVTFIGILAGTFVPVQVIRVFATSTTATNIIALW
jgi:hypothetical protein